MQSIKFEINEEGQGAFFFEDDGKRLGEMIISISGEVLIVHHTEVLPEMEGKGIAKKLLNAMVDHALVHQLKVLPYCPYVLSVFKKNPEKYEDVLYKEK
jgi:predicted GNAT family acetyltransferase